MSRDKSWDHGVVFGLTKAEAFLYRYMCREFEKDPSTYLQSRQFTLTPYHWAQLIIMASTVGAQEIAEAGHHPKAPTVPDSDFGEVLDGFMQKCGKKVLEQGEHDAFNKYRAYMGVHDMAIEKEHLDILPPQLDDWEVPEEFDNDAQAVAETLASNTMPDE